MQHVQLGPLHPGRGVGRVDREAAREKVLGPGEVGEEEAGLGAPPERRFVVREAAQGLVGVGLAAREVAAEHAQEAAHPESFGDLSDGDVHVGEGSVEVAATDGGDGAQHASPRIRRIVLEGAVEQRRRVVDAIVGEQGDGTVELHLRAFLERIAGRERDGRGERDGEVVAAACGQQRREVGRRAYVAGADAHPCLGTPGKGDRRPRDGHGAEAVVGRRHLDAAGRAVGQAIEERMRDPFAAQEREEFRGVEQSLQRAEHGPALGERVVAAGELGGGLRSQRVGAAGADEQVGDALHLLGEDLDACVEQQHAPAIAGERPRVGHPRRHGDEPRPRGRGCARRGRRRGDQVVPRTEPLDVGTVDAERDPLHRIIGLEHRPHEGGLAQRIGQSADRARCGPAKSLGSGSRET